MKEPAIFNEKGFTLFIFISSEESGDCPPCDAQMDIIKKIQGKLKDKLLVHTLTLIESAFTIDDLPEGYRPVIIGKPKAKEE
ncbi:hypothetical protein ABMY35_00140 [Pseudoalteromonas sp. BZB3]|uniref:hypothetical protein n=1 Tax=Pseudoalteromonas sp. BZB3 TaxID=3136670 RepID=UPI0032C3E417